MNGQKDGVEMKECPKCHRWTLELSISERALKCYNVDCGYVNNKPIDVDEYLDKNNALHYLVKSLTLNGYHAPTPSAKRLIAH